MTISDFSLALIFSFWRNSWGQTLRSNWTGIGNVNLNKTWHKQVDFNTCCSHRLLKCTWDQSFCGLHLVPIRCGYRIYIRKSSQISTTSKIIWRERNKSTQWFSRFRLMGKYETTLESLTTDEFMLLGCARSHASHLFGSSWCHGKIYLGPKWRVPFPILNNNNNHILSYTMRISDDTL